MSVRNGIIGAGNWVLDKIKLIDRWPGEGNLCTITGEIHSPGGGPCNVLFDLAAIDPALPLFAAGRLGNDAEGATLLDEMKKRGIDSSGITMSDTASTSFTDVMSGEGKRTFFHCRGANAEFNPADLDRIDFPAKFFYLGYLLLLDSFDRIDPATGKPAAVGALASIRAKGYRTIVDFVSDAPERFRTVVLPALPEIDILIVNEIEAQACCGCVLRDGDRLNAAGLPAAVDRLFELGVRETVIIHFPEGAAGRTRDGRYFYSPSIHIDAADIAGTTGAGDAFAAGTIYALHQEWAIEDAVRLGSASSYFNLLSPTATAGAVPLAKMTEFLKSCAFNPIP